MKSIKAWFMIILIISIMLIIGCTKPPVMHEGELYPCYAARDCDFRNPKNPEKCVPQWQECRTRERYSFCGDSKNRWPGKDEQSCWDKLNSK